LTAADDKPGDASAASLRGTGVATVVGKGSGLWSFNMSKGFAPARSNPMGG
jgi:hypothetical protein